MFTTAGWWGDFWASSTPDLQSWAWMIGSFLTGSLVAALVTIGWNWWSAKRGAKAREKAVIASLAGELRRSKALCESNAKLRDHPAPPFIRFPTSVALRATFEERHHFPKLAGLQKDLEHYTMGVSHINQMIELHDRLWASTEQAGGVSPGAAGRREHLRRQIADLCAGELKLEGVGPENFIILPTYTQVILKKIQELT